MGKVIKCLPRDGLCHLSLVCQQYRVPCQKELFRTVTLFGDSGGKPSPLAMFLQRQLCPNPHVIGVPRFIINMEMKLSTSTPKQSWSLKVVAKVLPHMIHLKSFTLFTMVDGPRDVLKEFAKQLGPQFPVGFERLTICTKRVSHVINFYCEFIPEPYQAMIKVGAKSALSLTSPESDQAWITWFSALVNVPMVTFIAYYPLWMEMLPLQTVRVWTSQARPELRRVEFWGSLFHVLHDENGLVDVVWPSFPWQGQCVVARCDRGAWSKLDEGAMMLSGPNAKVQTCECPGHQIVHMFTL